MAATSFELESALNGQAKLVVRMRFVSDRFATELALVTRQETIVILRSVEGTPEQTWPANGPLQEVVPQSVDDGSFLAGVGRGGKSHWSTIIAPTKTAAGIEFDFACRAKSEPDWLGSTYELLIEPHSVEQKPEQIEIPVRGQQLICRAMESTQTRLLDGTQIDFTAISEDATLPRTVRWKYRFELQ